MPDRIVAAYEAACQAANGWTPSVAHRAGWFTVRGKLQQYRFRAHELIAATSKLEARKPC